MKSRILLAFLFCFFAVPVFAQPGDEKAFLSGLKKTRSYINKGRWSKASKNLNKLLEAHANQDYVFKKQIEIEDCMTTCVFWEDYEQPEYKELLSGQLLSYKESSGAIKLRYTMKTMGDFTRGEDKDNARARTSGYVHPALFSGPFTIDVRGKKHPSMNSSLVPFFIAGLGSDSFYQIITGKKGEGEGNYTSWIPPRILCIGENKPARIEEKASSPATPNKPFVLKLKVSATKIAAYYGNKEIISTKKPRGEYGRAGFGNMPFDEVIITGKVQPAWLQGLRDAHMQKARNKFEKSFKLKHYMPEWLRREKSADVAELNVSNILIPGYYVEKQDKHMDKVLALYNEKKYEEGMEYIKKAPEEEICKVSRAFIKAIFLNKLEQYESALVQCEFACKGDPESYSAKLLCAKLKISMGQLHQAEEELERLKETYPDQVEVYALLSRRRLISGNMAEAKSLVEAARLKKLQSSDLDEVSRIIYKAENGPSWQKVHEYESKHYHIFSDIDQKICREAAKLLEESYTSYIVYLERIKDLDKDKFPVYLFSGQAGYLNYLRELTLMDNILSLGVYVPALKQLMIWNTPDRDMMLRTIRHEGFHQYMDRIAKDPPIWLNEGLAEYYEIAERVGGDWKLGKINSTHVNTLQERARDRISLEEFLNCNASEFKNSSTMYYAQSWAFVHFLRHSTKENKELFESLLESVKTKSSAEEVVKDLLDKVDLKQLQADFARHLNSLS